MASDLTSFVLGGKPRASHGQDDVRLPGVRPGDQLGVDVLGVVRNTGRVLHNSLDWRLTSSETSCDKVFLQSIKLRSF